MQNLFSDLMESFLKPTKYQNSAKMRKITFLTSEVLKP